IRTFNNLLGSASMALQISINSTTSTRLSPPSYLATNDCGRRRRLASWCCVRAAALRALIRKRFVLRNGPICRVCAHGEPSARETDPIIGLSEKGIYCNPVVAFWDLPGKGSELPSRWWWRMVAARSGHGSMFRWRLDPRRVEECLPDHVQDFGVDALIVQSTMIQKIAQSLLIKLQSSL